MRLWELLLHWGTSFLCFSNTKAPVGDHKVTNALFYPIPWNLRCLSLFSHLLIETECVHPSDDMLKENLWDTELIILNWRNTKKVLFLNASHLFSQCWQILTFTTFFLLQIVCYLFLDMRFPTEISCRFTIFAEFQQQKKTFEKTFQVLFVGDCCQTNLKHYSKPTARNFPVQSSSVAVRPQTVLSSFVLLLQPVSHNGFGVLQKTLTFMSVSGLQLLSLWQMGNQQRS